MSKRLVLFSQPSPIVWRKLDEVLFPNYLKDRVFAYMPSEGDAVELNAQYDPFWKEYVENNSAKLLTIDNSKRDHDAVVEAEKLESSSILMITGGNTFKLLNHLRESKLDQAIRKFWEKDNIVLSGFSAGAIVLSPSIETAKIYGDINEPELTDLSGLKIVNFEIWAHYEHNQLREVEDYKRKSLYDVKVIDNEGVLVIDK